MSASWDRIGRWLIATTLGLCACSSTGARIEDALPDPTDEAPALPAARLRAGEHLTLAVDRSCAPFDERRRAVEVELGLPSAGTLYVWVAADAGDPFLSVETRAGRVVDQDDDSGGGGTAYLCLSFDQPAELRLVAALELFDACGDVEIAAGFLPEADEETDRDVDEALALLDLVDEARGAQDPVRARASLEQSIELLCASMERRASEVAFLSLGRAALLAGELEDHRSGRRARETLLELIEELCPPDHEVRLNALAELARHLDGLGDVQQALALRGRCLELFERTSRGATRDARRMRMSMAVTLTNMGRLEEARELQERVLEEMLLGAPEARIDIAVARVNLGRTLLDLYRHAEGRALLELALPTMESELPADHPWTLIARTHLGAALFHLEDLQAALEVQTGVLEAYERTMPLESPSRQWAMGNLALTLKDLGYFSRAREIEEQVLELRTRHLDDAHPSLQIARMNLAGTLARMGDVRRASQLEEQALAAFTRELPDDNPTLWTARENHAVTLKQLGDLVGARRLIEAAVEFRSRTYTDDHPDLLRAQTVFAGVLEQSGENEAARALYQRILESRIPALEPSNPNLLRARADLASLEIKLGERVGAQATFEEVLALARETQPEDSPQVLNLTTRLAMVCNETGDYARAKELCLRALASLRILLASPEEDVNVQIAELGLAYASIQLGERDEAEQALARAIAGARAFVERMADTHAPREVDEVAANKLRFARSLIWLAGGPTWDAWTPELADQVLGLIETLRGAGLRSASWLRSASDDPELARLRARTRDAGERLAYLAQRFADRDELDRALVERDAAQRALASRVRELGLVAPSDQGLSATRIAAELAPDEALVEFWSNPATWLELDESQALAEDHRLLAFVVRPASPMRCIDLGQVVELRGIVQTWRDSLHGLGAPERGVSVIVQEAADAGERRLATQVRARLFDPLLASLEDASRIHVVADDVVHLLPLDALPWGDGLLGDRFQFASHATAADWIAPSAATLAGGFLGIGDVDYQVADASTPAAIPAVLPLGPGPDGALRDAGWSFAPLAGTRAEVEGIAELHERVADPAAQRGPRQLIGARATKEQLFELAPDCRWLHVATHGYFVPGYEGRTEPALDEVWRGSTFDGESAAAAVRRSSPLVLCGLALAGANRRDATSDDFTGLVTGEELATLDLSRCELAVLSACDTSVGVLRAGQGVASLQKALHMAGARSVITSLWKVPDQATQELMLDFYRRLWVEKKPKHQALWEAKLALRNARDPDGRPHYTTRDWAAWILTGAVER